MYFQVIIVSAGALEPAGPRHLNTRSLTLTVYRPIACLDSAISAAG